GAARARVGQPESGSAALLHSQGAGHERGAAGGGTLRLRHPPRTLSAGRTPTARAALRTSFCRYLRLHVTIPRRAVTVRVEANQALELGRGLIGAAQHLPACVT